MFLINANPLGSHTRLQDYAIFLMRRFIITQFHQGSDEVHVIFDNPGQLKNMPKYFEHLRRDATVTVSVNHSCISFTTSTHTEGKWRESVLNCRQCKRNLVLFLGQYLLNNIGTYLSSQQKCYIAGAFEGDIVDTAWFVQGQQSPQPDPLYLCNAEETDTRIWLHAKQTSGTKLLIVSPDTDVYVIGLPLQSMQQEQIVIQISLLHSQELHLLHPNRLVHAL